MLDFDLSKAFESCLIGILQEAKRIEKALQCKTIKSGCCVQDLRERLYLGAVEHQFHFRSPSSAMKTKLAMRKLKRQKRPITQIEIQSRQSFYLSEK